MGLTVQLMHIQPSRAFTPQDQTGAGRLAETRTSAFPYPDWRLAQLPPLGPGAFPDRPVGWGV